MFVDVYPSMAQYLTGVPVRIVIELAESVSRGTITLAIRHLATTIEVQTLSSGQETQFTIDLQHAYSCGGYGVDVELYKGGACIDRLSTAFDVVKSAEDAIRYGFLSDFDKADNNRDISTLRKYHINMLQYYDWSYRHDAFVGEQTVYSDMMGRVVDLAVVKDKIRCARSLGMKSLGYGPVYAASSEFLSSHPDWGLYNSLGNPLSLIDIFYIMNVSEGCGWRLHIIQQYTDAVTKVGFDGIHMDTYGFPKTAFTKSGDIVKLQDQYPSFIDDTYEALQQYLENPQLIFNNVSNWPVKGVATAKQSAIYIEVWPPFERYWHIRQIIADALREGNGKPVIIAAYLKPFKEDTPERAAFSAKLLTAVIVSCGATHLLLGEDNGVLTDPYYVDHAFLASEIVRSIRGYYDFAVRYYDLLYDRSLEDVSMTHSFWENTEYNCISHEWSPYPQPGRLWIAIRENASRKLLSLINLGGNDSDEWNRGKNVPATKEQVELHILVRGYVKGAFVVSPDLDNGKPCALDCTYLQTPLGLTLVLKVAKVELWSMVWIEA